MEVLKDRIAIVTGASSGIGKVVALEYAKEGASVVVCARRLENLEELVRQVTAAGGKAVAVTCDVTRDEDIDRVVQRTIEEFGTVHILANIAQGNMGDMSYLGEVTIQGALDSFISGPVQSLRFMQKCFPYMKEQNYGRIINTASHSALFGEKGFAAYIMAKGAVMALTRVASQEWAPYGIVTNTVLPVVRTEAYDMSEQGKDFAEYLKTAIPTGRFAPPEEIVGAFILLASEGASYINGQSLGLDGGWHLIA